MRACLAFMFALALLVALPGCFGKVEGTGRTQLLLTSAGSENAMGLDAYREVLKKEKRCTDPDINAMVQRIGQRLAVAAPQKGFEYEFTVLESKDANAFCLPGGKVCVYTGILPYCQNEAALAGVMGHEIAHAIARHGGERMSQQMIVGGLSAGLGVALQAKGIEASKSNMIMTAYGAGAQVGFLLPYSRTHEYEADYLGMTYMAKAGYDPHEIVSFWGRFGKGGSGMPAFLSTHPPSEERAKQMNEVMPKVMAIYAQSPKYGAGQPIPARYMTAPK